MNLYKFINSKDIREHLEKINYSFTSIEAAWMVWQSHYTSLKERHDAWNEIIATMSDCKIKERFNTRKHPSLHGFLKKLMEIENNTINSLKNDEPGVVYSYSYYIHDDLDWSEERESLSSKFSLCMEKARSRCQWCVDSSDISMHRIRIKKIWVDGIKQPIHAEFDGNGELQFILRYGDLTKHERNIVDFGFNGMWFAFPTPFQKGDILKGCNYFDEVFVFDGLDSESEFREQLEKRGDTSDMLARGYFQIEDSGRIYHDHMHYYMDLEYYHGEFTGVRRILKTLSNYLKDEIDLALYSNAYRTIIGEEHIKALFPCEVNDEGLTLAQLK